ncbi:exodeoxyribonuclease V subunit beta [Thermochromatium tepidum]|uniref:RecBCD enzyme subunit RecB n=1 Tax=Thermochromatium tepidum ATCC 43061 TaxID=316276 RepID=A0A6I6E1D2_THETI|nr:exodeoxyribonuclease V subunit beta [Thermochromatium tepidum]QGU33751.1 exodeoxyribonuclease V subunit beta [Thermochromatium tepidum ATCC 43061]
MKAAIQSLNPLEVPLYGSRLIEASAGTGKTFTLAMLYLRLVLGHGGETAFPRPLMPPEILVVTFTNAATEELRERIRRRLVEASAVFRAQTPRDPNDPWLLGLRDQLADSDLADHARRLELAADWMDEAAISTIHAWCYRMLREHAFDAASAFEQTLENDDAERLQRAAEDYWRTFVLGLSALHLEPVLEQWSQPSDLAKAVCGLLPLAESLPPVADPPDESVGRCLKTRRDRIATLKTDWRTQDHIGALERLFEQAVKDKAFKQTALNKNHRAKVLDGLRAWLGTPDQTELDIFGGQSWKRMSSLAIGEIWNDPDKAPVDHPACRALAELHETFISLPDPTEDLLTHAVHWIKSRVEREKHQGAILTQNDLLIRFDQALQGEGRERLAAAIRRQFPVALVDEFQDTDPLQYRIFSSIYEIQANQAATGFFMIGDPKQAIYAFRGADIHTYLIARAATQGRHYTLDVNYRASTDLIAAINALFEHGERTTTHGAFLFREPNGQGNPVPFHPAQARPQSERTLTIDGRPCPPLQAWIIPPGPSGTLNKEAYRAGTAKAAARTIAELLRLGQEGRALLPLDPDGERPLQPSDLAVLVNNRTEAEAIRAELRRLGVASVYLSERGNVFDTQIARDLAVLLRAIADPFDDRLMRQALATRLLAQGLTDLDRLNNDDLYWETLGERLSALNGRWRRQGFLPMLYRLIGEFQIAERLLATTDGERTMTDLLHLGELLQRASEALDGEQALVRFLEEAIADSRMATGEAPEARQLRLESDARLVRVVTIHKSKGLEYPLVFLPFIADCRRVSDKDRPLTTHDAEHRLQVHLSADPARVAQADRERLGEDLRKLYVGLTRARYANWLGLGAISDLRHSALGYLLGLNDLGERPAGGSVATARDDLAERLRPLTWLTLIELPSGDPPRLRAEMPLKLEGARPAPEWYPRPWWISSYSALSRGARLAETLDPSETLGSERLEDRVETASDETALEEASHPDNPLERHSPAGSLHAFPSGARYGTFLHGLLEWAGRASSQARHGFDCALAMTGSRRQMLERSCTRRGLGDWIEPLDTWLTTLIDRTWHLDALALPDGRIPQLRLADLDPDSYQVELEFWIECCTIDLGRLDQLITQHTLAGRKRPRLVASRLNGMLKGFIDLVFEHEGRYYVLDWKSNQLGQDDSAYTQEAMCAAITERRYDLQYVLYLLALHRQLRARLPDYDYDRHLGGAIYVFLRGTSSASQGLFMERPPRALIESLDRLFAGAFINQALK